MLAHKVSARTSAGSYQARALFVGNVGLPREHANLGKLAGESKTTHRRPRYVHLQPYTLRRLHVLYMYIMALFSLLPPSSVYSQDFHAARNHYHRVKWEFVLKLAREPPLYPICVGVGNPKKRSFKSKLVILWCAPPLLLPAAHAPRYHEKKSKAKRLQSCAGVLRISWCLVCF